MKIQFKRWLLERVDWVNTKLERLITAIREAYDTCEVCKLELVESECVACERRICGGCDSHYYFEGPELCTICRSEITPEQEAAELAECGVLYEEVYGVDEP